MDTSESSEPLQPIEGWAQLSDKWEASGNYLGACDAAFLGLEQHPEARELQYRAVLNLSRIGASKRARQLWLHYRLQPHCGFVRYQTATADISLAAAAKSARNHVW
jgi:hypothetical protein